MCINYRILHLLWVLIHWVPSIFVTYRRDEIFVCLCARKKTKPSPIMSTQNGYADFCKILHNNSTPRRNYSDRFFSIFNRFVFTGGQIFHYCIGLARVTEHYALPCIRVIGSITDVGRPVVVWSHRLCYAKLRKCLTQYVFKSRLKTSVFLSFPTNSSFVLEFWSYDLWKQINQINNLFHATMREETTEGHRDNNQCSET